MRYGHSTGTDTSHKALTIVRRLKVASEIMQSCPECVIASECMPGWSQAASASQRQIPPCASASASAAALVAMAAASRAGISLQQKGPLVLLRLANRLLSSPSC